jgi:hypothetical protein
MKKASMLGATALALALGAAPEAMAEWNGPYVGGHGGGVIFGNTVLWQGGGRGGFMFGSGPMLFGIEGQLGLAAIPGTIIGEAAVYARAGYSLGASGKALLYVEAGIGAFFVPGAATLNFAFGAGVEIKVSPTFSVFLEERAFGGPQGASVIPCCGPQLQIGFNWRP